MKEEKNKSSFAKASDDKQSSIMDDEKFMEFLTNKFGGIDEKFEKVDERFEKIEEDISYLKNNMVTKEYLDRKLGELEGRLILIIRKGDERFNLLIEILVERKAILPQDADKINSIELFPSLK